MDLIMYIQILCWIISSNLRSIQKCAPLQNSQKQLKPWELFSSVQESLKDIVKLQLAHLHINQTLTNSVNRYLTHFQISQQLTIGATDFPFSNKILLAGHSQCFSLKLLYQQFLLSSLFRCSIGRQKNVLELIHVTKVPRFLEYLFYCSCTTTNWSSR